MLKIAVILGSTRPGRNGEAVARWVLEHASGRDDAEYVLVDLLDHDLPLLDEPVPPTQHRYSKPHTMKWSETIAPFDAFVFVTPEYNHAPPAALKNALDYLYREWNDKAAGFVSYGSGGGLRAVEQLRQVMAELQIADVRQQVAFSLYTDFKDFKEFAPAPGHEKTLHGMLDQLVRWAKAMKTLRG